MDDGGWITEDVDPLSGGWYLDTPWVKASHLHWHESNIRGGDLRVMRLRLPLSRMGSEQIPHHLFYGDPSINPETFAGLATMFNTTNPEKAACAKNVVDVGYRGPGSTSIWLIGFGPRTVLMASDDGEPVRIGLNDVGLVVRDWRFVVRLCNIDPRTQDDLRRWLEGAIMLMPLIKSPSLRSIFYMNDDGRKNVPGDEPNYRGIPIRIMPQIRSDEARVYD